MKICFECISGKVVDYLLDNKIITEDKKIKTYTDITDIIKKNYRSLNEHR